MICLRKVLVVLVSVVFFRVQAMDGLFQVEKRVASQEISEADTRGTKRYKSIEHAKPVLTHDQFVRFLHTFDFVYFSFLTFNWYNDSVLADMEVDEEDDLVETIRQQAQRWMGKCYGESRLTKAEKKRMIQGWIKALADEGCLTQRQHFLFSLITLDADPICLDSVPEFMSEGDKDQALKELCSTISQMKSEKKLMIFIAAYILKHPLFPIILNDAEQMFKGAYKVPPKHLYEAIYWVIKELPAAGMSFTSFVYAVVYEVIVLGKVKEVPSCLFESGNFPAEYVSTDFEYCDMDRACDLLALTNAMLLPRSCLRDELSIEDLEVMWEMISCYESYFVEVNNDDLELAKSCLRRLYQLYQEKEGDVETLLQIGLSHPKDSLGAIIAFQYGAPLSLNILHRVWKKFEGSYLAGDPNCWYHLQEMIDVGLAKHMASIVYHSIIPPEEIDSERYRTSEKRVITVLCVFKHYAPLLPREIIGEIFSSDLELARDVLRVLHGAKQLNFRGLLGSFKLLSTDVKVALLKPDKMRRIKELLCHDDKGQTIRDVFTEELITQKGYYPAEFRGWEPTGLKLLNPEQVEDNLGQQVEESIRLQMKIA